MIAKQDKLKNISEMLFVFSEKREAYIIRRKKGSEDKGDNTLMGLNFKVCFSEIETLVNF